MAFVFRLENPDGSPADPPMLNAAGPRGIACRSAGEPCAWSANGTTTPTSRPRWSLRTRRV